MDCEVKLLKSGLPNRAAISGLIKFLDQALEHTGERDANDDTHGRVNHVAAQDELADSATNCA